MARNFTKDELEAVAAGWLVGKKAFRSFGGFHRMCSRTIVPSKRHPGPAGPDTNPLKTL